MSDSDVVAVLQRKDYRPAKDARYDMHEPLLKEYSRVITQNRSTYVNNPELSASLSPVQPAPVNPAETAPAD